MTVTIGNGTIEGLNSLNVSDELLMWGNATVPLNNDAYEVIIGSNDLESAISTFDVHNLGQKPLIDSITRCGANSILILSEGSVYAAHGGEAWSAAAGSATTNSSYYGTFKFKRVPIPSAFPIVSCGGSFGAAWALDQNGDLWTWGNNASGSCGVGSTAVISYPQLAASGVMEVFPARNTGYHIRDTRLFIRKYDGYIYGCGYNGNGALGDGTTTQRNSFVQLTGLGTDVASFWNMGCGYGCAVAQKYDGTIWVAGYNGHGQLGTGTTTNATSWTNTNANWNGGNYNQTISKVTGHFGYYDTGASGQSTLRMLMFDGSTQKYRVCGYNGQGQLGDGTTVNKSLPLTPAVIQTQLDAGATINDIASIGGLGTAQVLFSDYRLYAWGYNGTGTVGDGTTANKTTPVLIASDVFRLLSDGIDYHTYGFRAPSFIIRSDGLGMNNILWACGYNGQGQLGDGTTTQRNSYVKVKLPGRVKDLVNFIGSFEPDNGTSVTVFVTMGNSLYTCGYNGNSAILSQYGQATNIVVPLSFTLERASPMWNLLAI